MEIIRTKIKIINIIIFKSRPTPQRSPHGWVFVSIWHVDDVRPRQTLEKYRFMKRWVRAGAAVTTRAAGYVNLCNTSVPLQSRRKLALAGRVGYERCPWRLNKQKGPTALG